MGLRCSDVSCGVGPTDEDPEPVVDPRAVRQLHIHHGEGKEQTCEHMFHPACLVSAERVAAAGWGGVDEKTAGEEGADVEVSCPSCRAAGVISREEWDAGVLALA